jgi:hypothetical protein
MAKAQTEVEDEIENIEDAADENEPIYYKPKTLSLISAVSQWFSWAVIILVILVIVAQFQYLNNISTQNTTTIMELLADEQQGEQARLFVYTSILLPLLTGLSFFLLLQAASIGLNALLEIEFNQREP